MNDIIEEILVLVRNYYQSLYTGYDTYIDESNVVEHINGVFFRNAQVEERITSIRKICEE